MARKKKPQTVSEQLRQHLQDSKLSSYDLAWLTGVDASVISRFLRNDRGLTTPTLDALRMALY